MLCTLIRAIILSINIQVGLNMHLYDDIGDASSSLRGSICSYFELFSPNVTSFFDSGHPGQILYLFSKADQQFPF